MEQTEVSLCKKCGAHKVTLAHILRTCEALAKLRHHYLGSFSLDPEDARNMALELSWVFIKTWISFLRGTQYQLKSLSSSGPNRVRTH